MQPAGAGVDSHGIPRADGGSKGFLKHFELRPECAAAHPQMARVTGDLVRYRLADGAALPTDGRMPADPRE